MALELYWRSQEEMCFECNQIVPVGEIQQCEECTVDLCSLCGTQSLPYMWIAETEKTKASENKNFRNLHYRSDTVDGYIL